jgi:hypothetical protein
VSNVTEAIPANVLALKGYQTVSGVAEGATRLKLGQNDPVIFHKDLYRIPLCNIQVSSDFDGQNNSSQFINPPYNTSGLHMLFLL